YHLSPCIHFYLLRHRPLPSSTLFPYTTLFRSQRLVPQLHGGIDPRRMATQPLHVGGRCARAIEPQRALGQPVPSKQQAQQRRLADRKSTRLNSSHLVISYAVFCLKKKKKNTKK